MSRKTELLEALNFIDSIIVDYDKDVERIRKNGDLSEVGKENEQTKALNKHGARLEETAKAMLSIVNGGVQDLTALWEQQSRDNLNDGALINLLDAVKVGALSQGDFNAIAMQYAKNPAALSMIDNAIITSGANLFIDGATDNRKQQLNRLENFTGNVCGINRNSLKDSDFFAVSVSGLKDFVGTMQDDLTTE